jgi:Tfp pilus assembly protein PilV|eukprot:TRINITY_DN95832_c0_g1_i1.p1 TRINITY_DN95832_c0_g1~~TRINITY_DN95832_c0_g1_i1.p1  ORF type:complete len:431 (+),score=58.14 TRINITY_DN95832_c0_g1_i1:313-1605(+)
MKKTKRKGLSFLELVIAMTLTFLSITFLMGLFITSIRNGERSKKRTTAAVMAQSTLERLSAFTADQIVSTTANFDPPMQDYTYNVDVQPAGNYTGSGNDPDLKQVICTVTDPAGNQSTMVALRQAATPLYGAVVNRANDNVVFTQDPVRYASRYTGPQPIYCNGTTSPGATQTSGADPRPFINWYAPPVFLNPAKDPQMPGGGQAGAICASPDLSAFCAVDINNRGIRFISQTSPSWSTLATPTGLGHPSGVSGSLTAGSEHIFLGDDKNRCLWEYRRSANTWNGPLAPSGMGRVASLGSDDALTTVWAIDVNAKGLRKYDVASGTWSFTAPGAVLPAVGNMVGLAVSGDGKKAFVCDEQNLYVLDTLTNNWSVPPSVLSAGGMPSKLTSDMPQSLATNLDGTKLWASPVYGSLYYYDVVGDHWFEDYLP